MADITRGLLAPLLPLSQPFRAATCFGPIRRPSRPGQRILVGFAACAPTTSLFPLVGSELAKGRSPGGVIVENQYRRQRPPLIAA